MRSDRYIEEQYRQKLHSGFFGGLLSIGLNAAILLVCSFSGLKYIYPPPEEKTMVIDFEQQDAPVIKKQKKGREPSAEEADVQKKLELVQKSEAPVEGRKQNLAKAGTVDDHGDVEVTKPKREEEEIDNRALFHAAKNTEKDTLAAQTARKVSDALKAGHASGNTEKGKVEGAPNARLKGRNVVGVPVSPSYDVQNSGVVVVDISVDNQGVVQRAVAGADGTTVTDKNLWNAARKAALQTRFNVDPTAPGLQQGTITYIFKLK